MTLLDFTLLKETEQLDLLYQSGTYLAKLKRCNSTSVLYQFEGFYIEISYARYRIQVRSIWCFESTIPLDPYLQEISIEEVINC